MLGTSGGGSARDGARFMENVNPCVRDLTVRVPWESVERDRLDLITSSGDLKVPGFRRGKAPPSVLGKYYNPEIQDLLKERYAPTYVIQEVHRRALRIASGPEIHRIRFSEGQPLEIDATIEVFAPFELGEYRNLTVEVPDPTSDEDIDTAVQTQLSALQARHASFHNVDPRPIQDGDWVATSVRIRLENGETILSLDDEMIEISEEVEPQDLVEALRGRQPGETVDFEYPCPANLFVRKIAGKTLHCSLIIIQIRERELPELDDEFAKDVDNKLETLEDLLNAVRNPIKTFLENAERDAMHRQITEKLAEAYPMALPQRYMESRLDEELDRIEATMHLEESGEEQEINSLEALTVQLDEELTNEQIDAIKTQLEVQVRAEQVLDRIALVESLQITDEELQQMLISTSRSWNVPVDQIARELSETGGMVSWRALRLRAKAMDLVLNDANRIPASDTSQDSETSADET